MSGLIANLQGECYCHKKFIRRQLTCPVAPLNPLNPGNGTETVNFTARQARSRVRSSIGSRCSAAIVIQV